MGTLPAAIHPPRRRLGGVPALLAALALAACGPADGPREIRKTRIVEPVDVPSARASTAHPGGVPGMGGPGMGGGVPGMPASGGSGGGFGAPASGGSDVHYTLPEGWVEKPTSSMRAANFTLAADPRVECYLSLLPGEAGGLTDNVNRWRKQMGLPPLSDQEVADLPRVDFLGGRAAALDVTGTWGGMSGSEAEAGWRMLGLLVCESSGSKFLKMVGPDATVAAERARFGELAASMHSGAGHSHGDGGATADAAFPADVPGMGSGGVAPPPRSVSQGIGWQAPAGWTAAPEAMFRNANYFAGSQEVEAFVTILPGDAGGPLANVNRWRDQMGQSPLTSAGFELLERVPMLGSTGVLVEIEGTYRSMSGVTTSDAMMLGALGQAPGRSVFVKMIGPRALVLRQREAFLEFCRSLEVESGS